MEDKPKNVTVHKEEMKSRIKNDEKDKDDHKHLGFCFQTMDDGMSLTDISESEVYEA